jgi:hypothetical protein
MISLGSPVANLGFHREVTASPALPTQSMTSKNPRLKRFHPGFGGVQFSTRMVPEREKYASRRCGHLRLQSELFIVGDCRLQRAR